MKKTNEQHRYLSYLPLAHMLERNAQVMRRQDLKLIILKHFLIDFLTPRPL